MRGRKLAGTTRHKVGLYDMDWELLQVFFPNSAAEVIRTLVHSYCERLRKDSERGNAGRTIQQISEGVESRSEGLDHPEVPRSEGEVGTREERSEVRGPTNEVFRGPLFSRREAG